MEDIYLIRRTDTDDEEEMYWSNEYGWCPLELADHFYFIETKTLSLPISNCEWWLL